MIKDTSTFSTVAIVVVLLPIAGIGATTFITTTFAQIGGPEEITFRTDLGEPFFKENGKITGQKEIGFLNNILGIFETELDEKGSFVSNEW
jgi:hypothetical protein